MSSMSALSEKSPVGPRPMTVEHCAAAQGAADGAAKATTTASNTASLKAALWRDSSRRAWALLLGTQIPALLQRLKEARDAGDVDDVITTARGALSDSAAAEAAYLVDLRPDGALTAWLLEAAPSQPHWGLLLTTDLNPMALRRWARDVLSGADPFDDRVTVAWGVLDGAPAPKPDADRIPTAASTTAADRVDAPVLHVTLRRPATARPRQRYLRDDQGWRLVPVSVHPQALSWSSSTDRVLPERLHALASIDMDWRVQLRWPEPDHPSGAIVAKPVAGDGLERLGSLDFVGMSGPTRRACGPDIDFQVPVIAASALPAGIAAEASPRVDRLDARWGAAMPSPATDGRAPATVAPATPSFDGAAAWVFTLPEEQRLLVWSRQARAEAGQAAALDTRVRLESDGQVLDPARWREGFERLDQLMAQAIGRLADAWKVAECLVSADLNAHPALLAAEAGIAWGYREAATPDIAPSMQVAGHLRGCLCRWDLSLAGTVDVDGARASVRLALIDDPTLMDVDARWEMALTDAAEAVHTDPSIGGLAGAGAGDGTIAAAAGSDASLPWRTFRLPFRVSVEPQASPAAALVADIDWAASSSLPMPGAAPSRRSAGGSGSGSAAALIAAPALVGGIGLRRSRRGNGLEWAFEATLEPVTVRIGLNDPWTGRRERCLSWLPALPLMDWCWAA
ncbi:hypothetical protein [Roseateles amylovorans]|uniref:Uncharacterized protein n=1 Tax=Roseateles amylovorans TaxID=2978473 RepID=A0ABY6ATI5_9BURK|nr:hypothetical protein [Roseateles amylovorans]UXH76147.1 hypothetical protein N4261_13800 [Roseateles amylovorans]